MEALVERVSRVLQRHPEPALPLEVVRDLVRETGVAVPEPVLLRSLASAGERVKVVDPWKGPWRALSDPREPLARPPGSVDRANGGRDRGSRPTRLGEGVWVVGRTGPVGSADDLPGPLRRLRTSLIHLGWTVDAESGRDLARWCGMLVEARRIHRRLLGAC